MADKVNRYRFTGEFAKSFPTLGFTLQPGDEFDWPGELVSAELEPVSKSKAPATPADSNPKEG